MKSILAGTAGHIDHGKTSLVRALTGVDTDRLKEEKERGISIDLGFAHLDVGPALRLGFVDVPGHERFIKNMLAGAAGIDLVLFVVAADESIKPQTREHFHICRLLGIRTGIIVLTKADLVDSDLLELVRLEVDEFVTGSFLEGAPVVPVSATSGFGISELRETLRTLALQLEEKDACQYFRLPVDRSFAVKGFGTVVTGTLLAGTMRVEDEAELFPGARRLRVRGLQAHGSPVKKVNAGQRTAANLAGTSTAEITRGMMLCAPGRFHETNQLDCSLELLASAKDMKHRAPVHFHAGTAEVEAEVRLLDRSPTFPSGKSGYARFLLREPLLLLPGDRFIVRMFSPVVTIGGGVVLDIAAPRRGGIERLRLLEKGNLSQIIALLVRESRFGMGLSELVARTGRTDNAVKEAAQASGVVVLESPQLWFLDEDWTKTRLEQMQELLKLHHRKNPLLAGVPKEEVRVALLEGAPAFLLDALAARTKTIVTTGEVMHLASHKVALRQEEEDAASRIEAAFGAAGLAVPGLTEVLAKSGIDTARARTLLQILLRSRKLVRINDDLVFHAGAIDQLRALLSSKKGVRFGVPEFKDWTGISRKYAIPLLEYLDREHLTRREGDARIVL